MCVRVVVCLVREVCVCACVVVYVCVVYGVVFACIGGVEGGISVEVRLPRRGESPNN